MIRNPYQKLVFDLLRERPVAYSPGLAKALGSVKAALFLSQLLYWHEKGTNPNWIFKTIVEMKEETGLSRREQEGAIQTLSKKKILEIQLKGMPAKRHFKVSIDRLVKVLEDYYGAINL